MCPSPCIDVVLNVSIWYAISRTIVANQWHDKRQRQGDREVITDIDVKLSWLICTAPRTKHLMVDHVICLVKWLPIL